LNTAAHRRKPKKILIVDDTPDNVQFLALRLRSANFEVHVAFSGEDGIQKARQEPPDLIILDVMMPGLNGFQVCRKLKQDPTFEQTPIVFLTAKDQPSDRFWGFEVGATEYLTKPIDPRMLVQKVQQLLQVT